MRLIKRRFLFIKFGDTNMKRPNPTTVRFKDDQLERLKELSKEDNCAVNYLIRKAVNEYLIKRGK